MKRGVKEIFYESHNDGRYIAITEVFSRQLERKIGMKPSDCISDKVIHEQQKAQIKDYMVPKDVCLISFEHKKFVVYPCLIEALIMHKIYPLSVDNTIDPTDEIIYSLRPGVIVIRQQGKEGKWKFFLTGEGDQPQFMAKAVERLDDDVDYAQNSAISAQLLQKVELCHVTRDYRHYLKLRVYQDQTTIFGFPAHVSTYGQLKVKALKALSEVVKGVMSSEDMVNSRVIYSLDGYFIVDHTLNEIKNFLFSEIMDIIGGYHHDDGVSVYNHTIIPLIYKNEPYTVRIALYRMREAAFKLNKYFENKTQKLMGKYKFFLSWNGRYICDSSIRYYNIDYGHETRTIWRVQGTPFMLRQTKASGEATLNGRPVLVSTLAELVTS